MIDHAIFVYLKCLELRHPTLTWTSNFLACHCWCPAPNPGFSNRSLQGCGAHMILKCQQGKELANSRSLKRFIFPMLKCRFGDSHLSIGKIQLLQGGMTVPYSFVRRRAEGEREHRNVTSARFWTACTGPPGAVPSAAAASPADVNLPHTQGPDCPLEESFSIFLTLQPFNKVPHLEVTSPNHKIVFITVILLWSWIVT